MEKTASEIAILKKNVRMQEWERQIEEQKSSGLSVQEWCQQHSIKPKTYYYHLRKVREEYLMLGKGENSQEKKETERAVVPILAAPSGGNISIEKNGLHITFPENISAEILIAVVDKLC